MSSDTQVNLDMPSDSNMTDEDSLDNDNESISSEKTQEVEDDRVSQATQKTRIGSAASKKSSMSRAGSAISKKSNLTRAGSGKSQKSVVWSTGGISDVGSEFGLLDEDEEIKEKKKNCCSGIISGMWASREMLKDNKDQQLYVKVSLRELILYGCFLFVIQYMTFSPYTPMYYKYKQAVKNLFKRQMDITNLNQTWKFLENDMIDGLYWETLYNVGYKRAPGQKIQPLNCPFNDVPATAPCPVDPADRNIMYENRMLGFPRLRMLKMRNNSCVVENAFSGAIKTCFAPYDNNKEKLDTENFGLANFPDFRKHSSFSAWSYQTSEALGGGAKFRGKVANYDADGYTQTLHYMKNESLAIVQELKRGLWIDQGTRLVVIDFSMYNANLNLFCIVKMAFEFPATGGVYPYQKIDTVNLLKYTTKPDYFLWATELVFCLYILYYIIEESLEIKIQKLKYFKNVGNLLDLVVIGISLTQIAFNVINFIKTPELIREMLAKPFEYCDFSQLASNNQLLVEFAAFNVFVAWVKVFKYLSFNKTMTQLSGTLSAATKDLGGFVVIFMTIFAAYSQLGYLHFGVQLEEFSTLETSAYTLFRMILGDFNFKNIETASPFFGVIFFLTYIFFVFFVLLNMFLAIINDTYAVVKADSMSKKADFQMSDFFKTGVNNVRGSMGIQDRGVDVENAIKLAAADDGFVTYDELRENLRKARFSDVEIDLFFHIFQNDPEIKQILLDEEELKAMQMAEDKRRMSSSISYNRSGKMSGRSSRYSRRLRDDSDGESDEDRPKSGKSARQRRASRRASEIRSREKVLDSEYYGLEKRINTMESAIISTASSLDEVLEKLNKDEKERKIGRKEMENIFDNIVNNGEDEKSKINQMEALMEKLQDVKQ